MKIGGINIEIMESVFKLQKSFTEHFGRQKVVFNELIIVLSLIHLSTVCKALYLNNRLNHSNRVISNNYTKVISLFVLSVVY